MYAKVPNDIIIGEDVMMEVNVTVFGSNHVFDRTDIPMRKQGIKKEKPVIIENDVWIGNNAIIMSARIISKGTIVGAGSVVTKDFPPYSIIGGESCKVD
jgi:maltose O-acetyltransferase